MAVFKRVTCKSCGNVKQAMKEIKTPPACQKCGGKTEYSEKWYVLVWTEDSLGRKKKVVKAVSNNKRFAEDCESKLKTQRAEGKFFDKQQPMPFTEAAETFMQFCKDRVAEGHLTPRSMEFYVGRLRSNLLPYWREADVLRITPEEIDGYKKERMAVVSPASVNRELATLKRLLSVLVEKRVLSVNPALSVKMLKESNKRDRFLTQEEIDRLLEECVAPHLRIAVAIAVNTGMRLNTILTLKWSHIDFAKGEVANASKGGKLIRVPMTQQLRSELLRYRENAVISINGWLIPSPKNPFACMRVDANFGFHTACRRAGIANFTFHDLRHTFASHFLMRTKDIHTLAQILGHSTTYMTERYTHILDDAKREAMRIFEEG